LKPSEQKFPLKRSMRTPAGTGRNDERSVCALRRSGATRLISTALPGTPARAAAEITRPGGTPSTTPTTIRLRASSASRNTTPSTAKTPAIIRRIPPCSSAKS